MISATNSTTQSLSSTNGTNPASQVSGPTVFWALLPLALNAMAQDSPTTRKLFHTKRTKEGLLTPTLSSPIFCLADSCVDFYLIALAILRLGRQGPPLAERSPEPGRRPSKLGLLVGVRMLLIIFGVITQAIRLYGMSGIPLTQAVATMYLATSLLRLLRLRLSPSEEDENEGDDNVFPEECSFTKPLAVATVNFILSNGFIISHLLAYIWLWDGFSKSFYNHIQDSATNDLGHAVRWCSGIWFGLCLLGTLLWVACFLFNIIQPFQRIGPLPLWLVNYVLFSMRSLVMTVTPRTLSEMLVDSPMILAIAMAYLLAILLKLLLQMIYGDFENADNIDSASMEMVDSQDNREGGGLLQNDLESANSGEISIARSEPTTADQIEGSRADKIVDPLYTLQLHCFCSFSLLVERNMGVEDSTTEPIRDLSSRYPWPADSVLKCRRMGYHWRYSMVELPRAIVYILSAHRFCAGSVSSTQPIPSDNGDGESPRRNHTNTQSEQGPHLYLLGVLMELWSLIFFCTAQSAFFVIALCIAFFNGSKMSPRIESLYDRYVLKNQSLTFALVNLITAGVRCMYLWDGSGTLMPSWESWFG